jgi:molybdenum cofactor cytidylyltransferase/nicotine blue oxidoreductase
MIRGLLLAAGAGRRMGMPKALVRDESGESWLLRGVETLRAGGCEEVTVVLGAAADEAAALLDGAGVDVVVAADWAEGMGASLRTGLASVGAGVEAVLVSLVDLPDVSADVVRRVLDAEVDDGVLRRAAYDGRPGHPVLLGRAHWPGVTASATGDRGARDYLAHGAVTLVECGDLATGEDRDTP